jgi:hypothetical protein
MNRLILFAVVFIGVLLLGGIVLYFYGYFNLKLNADAYPSQDISSCAALQDANAKDICYFNIAVASSNISTCSLINETWRKGDCYTLIRGK